MAFWASTLLRVVRKPVDAVIAVFSLVTVLALAVMALLLIYEIFMRYVMQKPQDWVLDMVQLVQVTLAFTAAAPVLKAGGHISMGLLTSFVGSRQQKWLEVIAYTVSSAGSVWMSVLSWRTFSRSYQISEAAYGIALPLYPWKFLVPLGFFVLGLQFMVMALERIVMLRQGGSGDEDMG